MISGYFIFPSDQSRKLKCKTEVPAKTQLIQQQIDAEIRFQTVV